MKKAVFYVEDEEYKSVSGKFPGEFELVSKGTPVDREADYYIILSKTAKTSENIALSLRNLGIAPEKILEYCYYEKELQFHPLSEFYKKSAGNSYHAFLLGMSHSHSGFIEQIAKKNIYKFSVPSMDLYYQMKLLEDLTLKYDLSKVDTVIFEFPYYIFNYDISMTKDTFLRRMNYYYYFEDYHHYSEKEDQSRQIEMFETLNRILIPSLYSRAQEEKAAARKENILYRNLKKQYYRLRYAFTKKKEHQWAESEMEQVAGLQPHVWCKEHIQTIEENVKIWRTIRKRLAEYPNLKIKVIVFPFCPFFIESHKKEIAAMKMIFYKNIQIPREDILDCFEFFLDKPEYFTDECHLNEKGKYEFTKKVRGL